MTLKIVTDSTCDLPAAFLARHDVTVVPVYINIGEDSFREGVEISRRELYENLYAYQEYPTTAAPAVGTFTAVYEKLAAAGATEILSIHLSSALSNTYNAARLGAAAVPHISVTLYDTEQITLGGGLQVWLAAEAATGGCTAVEVTDMLAKHTPRTYVFGMIDTLESLRRSGRVNWATFGIGSLLNIKPVMMIHRGRITMAARVRTRKRSQTHMMSLVSTLSPFVRLAIIHVNAPAAATALAERAASLFPTEQPPLIAEVTPAIGVHLGLGAVGFACVTAGDRVLEN